MLKFSVKTNCVNGMWKKMHFVGYSKLSSLNFRKRLEFKLKTFKLNL